jgi:D-alanine-D-alanine ligase
MRIAFTHNLQLSTSEDEAEFDTPETVAGISACLRKLGHQVEPVEVSGPASRLVARLEALVPDLVFNTAEGSHGRFREAFYPALFDRLGLPFTGSDAYVCALTLDKRLTKMVAAQYGVTTPKFCFVEDVTQLPAADNLRFPLIVKPNFEGSSVGITVDSVVETHEQLTARVLDLVERFPAGVLIEEFIIGRDLTVPFIEKASPLTAGVLEPASYQYDQSFVAGRRFQLYDFELKNVGSNAVSVHVPAEIGLAARARSIELTQKVIRALGIRDMGRVDFRVGEDGEVYFLEVNALPSLEKGAAIYVSSALAGLPTQEAVLDTILRSAAERYGLSQSAMPARRSAQRLRVGLTYNVRRTPQVTVDHDQDAEYDTPQTIAAIREAIESYGHTVVELEATPELSTLLPAAAVDVVFNIAEGIGGRNREAQVPALLELLGIPYTGSDPAAMSLTLDKSLAKQIVAQAGCATPASLVMRTGKERLPKGLEFPLMVKPVAEGSSKGILGRSVVESDAELREAARELINKYKQDALVESYLPGREFTVALLGESKPKALPPMEVIFTDPSRKHPIYDFNCKFKSEGTGYEVPAKVDEPLLREIERVAKRAFIALGARDYGRVDLRLDAAGRVNFIECNPLPGLSPGFSDMCLIADGVGISYRTLIGEILAPCIRRYRESRRLRAIEGRL